MYLSTQVLGTPARVHAGLRDFFLKKKKKDHSGRRVVPRKE